MLQLPNLLTPSFPLCICLMWGRISLFSIYFLFYLIFFDHIVTFDEPLPIFSLFLFTTSCPFNKYSVSQSCEDNFLSHFFWFLSSCENLCQPSGYPRLLVRVKSEPLEGHCELAVLTGWWASRITWGGMTRSISSLSLGQPPSISTFCVFPQEPSTFSKERSSNIVQGNRPS